MISEAVLYLAAPDDRRAARRLVAGRPVAFRALAVALRAGCRRVGVPAVFRGSVLERAIAATPSARRAAYWLEPGTPPPAGPVALLPAAAVVPVSAMATLFGSPAPAVLAESLESDAPLVVVTDDVIGRLWSDLAAGEPMGDAVARVLKDGAPHVAFAGAWYARVTTDADARAAEAHLWVGLGSAIDSGFDRAFHRRLSRPLTRLAVRWAFTPNQVSVASLIVGGVAAWCFWRATPAWALAGLLVYAASVVLDHSDGEVARLTLAESTLGEWLDVLIDTLVHAAIALAMGATTATLMGTTGAVLGVVAAVGFVASSALAKTAPAPVRGDRVGTALSDLGARDGFYVMLVLFLAVLTAWPAALPALMIVVAVGSQAYWVSRAVHRLVAWRLAARRLAGRRGTR